MQSVRLILHCAGLLGGVGNDVLREDCSRVQHPIGVDQLTPWRLRASVHDRLLSDDEFAVFSAISRGIAAFVRTRNAKQRQRRR